jgi:hypothetical protein
MGQDFPCVILGYCPEVEDTALFWAIMQHVVDYTTTHCIIAQKSPVLSIVLFVHEELNLMLYGRPVQLVKIMIQAVGMSRDVAVLVYYQIPKYVHNVHRGVVT